LTSPKLKRLKNVQHLHTEIKGILNGGHWLQSFEILRQLHPTAAVGGEPQEIAVQLIQASEACDRGWYAAPIGWVNSKGEGIFAVGIRSGYLNGDSARIYAGAGIVADSDIASELGETAIKFEALLKALGSLRL
jgi:menaquinone-specific isochorismate synthase